MATKFLTTEELNNLKEEIKMTELGTMIFNDGVLQSAIENARNFFTNNAPFELVRNSINVEIISDIQLKEIYDEVQASKKEKANA